MLSKNLTSSLALKLPLLGVFFVTFTWKLDSVVELMPYRSPSEDLTCSPVLRTYMSIIYE